MRVDGSLEAVRVCGSRSGGNSAAGMARLEAMKLSGAKLNGEMMGRVLRSRAAKSVQPSGAKLVDSKLTFKVKKEAKSVQREKPRAKREAGAEPVAESSAGAVELGKKSRKTSKKTIVVSETVVTQVATGLGSSVVEKVTISCSSSESWSISLSNAQALAEATKHLLAADTKLAQIIGSHGGSPVWERKGSCFTALTRSIVYQQLAGKAASAIYGRLVALCGVLHIPLFSVC